jgi:probable DNA metabolism protein
VLPLIGDHFASRFADQAWIIYDTQRHYGLLFDGTETRRVAMDDAAAAAGVSEACGEALCQALWRRYYAAVNIAGRRNPRLHRQKLPRRYWRFLTEKGPGAASH